jgi:hypothetical protein
MKQNLTPKQQINAELASRSFNQKAKEVIKSTNPKDVVPDLVIDFVCECSDDACQDKVPLTIKQYDKIHNNHMRFVLATDHEQTPVDVVKAKTPSFTIVEKPALLRTSD